MGLEVVHFLNVGSGDCSIIEHTSGRVTMIDICGGNLEPEDELVELYRARKPKGNFRMCQYPTNPIIYLAEVGIKSLFRFILTHPDMDHMDGLTRLLDAMSVLNFWDSGVRKEKPDFGRGSPYSEEDWDAYERIISGRSGTKVVTPRAGDRGKYWNSDDAHGPGDRLQIVAPDDHLVQTANDTGETNDASYVIVYESSAGPIIFAGDSHDKTWEYILNEHRDLVRNAAVLFAPHHGRKSGRDYSFLDVVNPRVSFFGCAPYNDLAYSAWWYRGLLYFTNNQCGNVRIYPTSSGNVEVFIENQQYADAYAIRNGYTTYEYDGYWFLCSV